MTSETVTPVRAWRTIGHWAWWAFETAANATLAFVAGSWLAAHLVGISALGRGLAAATIAVVTFCLLTDLDKTFASLLARHRGARRCAACGHPKRPGDGLRFYRMERRYPRGSVRLPYWVPRYEILRSHRSHLTDPESGLYQPLWRRLLRVTGG